MADGYNWSQIWLSFIWLMLGLYGALILAMAAMVLITIYMALPGLWGWLYGR